MVDPGDETDRLAADLINVFDEVDPARMRRLGNLLAQCRRSDIVSGAAGVDLSLDSGGWVRRLRDVVAQGETTDAPRFRVFRREMPVAAPGVLRATPDWGGGAAVTESLGPFVDAEGRQFWFDFYPILKLVPIFLAGDSEPAMLFRVHQRKLQEPDVFTPPTFLRLLKGQQYTLAAGSVWIRADLLAGSAPSGRYVGLKIRGGRLTFTPIPQKAGDNLVIPAAGKVSARLALQAPATPAAPGTAGTDATAGLDLPASFAFTLDSQGVTPTELGDAGWALYGDGLRFAFDGGAAPSYEPALESIVIPMATSKPEAEVRATASPLVQPAGAATILQAGWALPTAAIDVTSPPAAVGAGGLAVRTAPGITLGWRGLQDGPVALRSPWLSLMPGQLTVVDKGARGRYAHQTVRLWQENGTPFRSELRCQYSNRFPLRYIADAAEGAEVLLVETDIDARIDRPVDVRGTPLSARTLGSALALWYTDAEQRVIVVDDNILVDATDPDADWPEPRAVTSLAIRNALLTTTPVNTLLLWATLADEKHADRGTLVLGMGLYGLLPTLPDPYAANVGFLQRSTRRGGQVLLLLAAATGWEPGANGDEVAVRFTFLPAGNFVAGGFDAQAVAGHTGPPPPSPPAPAEGALLATASDIPPEQAWANLFEGFSQEQFALLDVSSNADQMGVSFASYTTSDADSRGPVFYRVYGVKDADDSSEFPLQIRDLDLSAHARFVRAFTVPQISWEPLYNLPGPQPPIPGDPPLAFNHYPNDGGPTRLLSNSVELVPIAPIPVVEFLVQDFAHHPDNGFTGGLFTLPFGLRAFAEFSRRNQFDSALGGAELGFNRPEYESGTLVGGLQLRADAPKHPTESPIFKGSTLQMANVLNAGGSPTGAGTLGKSVGKIFNDEFFFDGATGFKDRGVPLTRIDFSGYGASIFSHWQNPTAAIAATSQSFFDVFVGRTAHEVIQVRSLLYPWGIRVVRTITIFRTSSAHVFRFDTGWQAESDGVYDFRYTAYDPASKPFPQPNPYEFHPGIVRRITRVRNIIETTAVPNFTPTWFKSNGDPYIDDNGIVRVVNGSTPANERSPQVDLQPVYFDADVVIDGVKSGGVGGRVPSKGMLGFVQIAPRGEPISPALFADLLESQFGSLGGPVDCVVELAGSGQLMRLARVDVSAADDLAGEKVFVSAGRGTVVLPKDGSWSVVVHNQGTGEVTSLAVGASVPAIRRGRLNDVTKSTDATPADLLRIAAPVDLVKAADASTRNFGFLQSTGTQKALFRLPGFKPGAKELFGAPPDFADAYRILNSVGIFPKVQDALPLALGAFKTKIIEEGYRLVDDANPAKVFEQVLLEGPVYLVKEDFLKIYVEYDKKDKNGVKTSAGNLRYGFDSAAATIGKRWLSKVDDIQMVVDLGPLTRLMMIRGRFDAEKGADPAFIDPQLEFSDALQPVIDILQILLKLQGGDYKAAFAKGLEIAMSNSADSWKYSFHARKEIPIVRFPPGPAYDAPQTPFKLEAHLAVGVYFNEALTPTSDVKQLVPSIGAFLEFGGRVSVMCLSVAAATVYATGSVDLRTAADVKTGPSLAMKFGFGAEVVAGLPVVGSVSLLFMVGVEISLDKTQLTITAFLLFRGRAEILGGIVTVTITIEARGSVKRLSGSGRTDMIAQVTFGLDISIFLVINISFSESWQETRQIA